MKPRETISCGEKREEPTGKKKYKNWIVCSLYVTGHFSLIEEIFQQTLSAYEKKMTLRTAETLKGKRGNLSLAVSMCDGPDFIQRFQRFSIRHCLRFSLLGDGERDVTSGSAAQTFSYLLKQLYLVDTCTVSQLVLLTLVHQTPTQGKI